MVPALDAPSAASSCASNAALALRGAPCACAEIARTASIDAAPEAARAGGRPRRAAGAAGFLPPAPSAWGSAAPALRLPSALPGSGSLAAAAAAAAGGCMPACLRDARRSPPSASAAAAAWPRLPATCSNCSDSGASGDTEAEATTSSSIRRPSACSKSSFPLLVLPSASMTASAAQPAEASCSPTATTASSDVRRCLRS
mmetsp:Transcript_36151/g.107180  ORF Transcript_36151/g.107180 Transcript_36151/m.107180 type:complete len:200 (-) Transcript_36151:69-668(-)